MRSVQNIKEKTEKNPSYLAVRHPCSKVGADLFEIQNKYYLIFILINYYSNFIEVEQLKHTTSYEIINHCKSQFARHGLPDICFFSSFPRNMAPVESNGMAEKAVQTNKNILRKVTEDKERLIFYLALLDLRNTAITKDSGSPVQKHMGRRTRTLLPIYTSTSYS